MENRDPVLVLERLRSVVLPSVEDYWRADAVVSNFLDHHFSAQPGSSETANCGKVALSAFFGGKAVEEAMGGHALPWMNRTAMANVLKRLQIGFTKVNGTFPSLGLTLIQWQGIPNARAFRGSDLVHTHWVAVVENHFFDINWPAWVPQKNWEELVVDELMARKGATGWTVLTSFAFGG